MFCMISPVNGMVHAHRSDALSFYSWMMEALS